jgi:hypothetical protein
VRTGISKIAGTIGLAVGVVVIGGSVVGGIALANDRGHDPAPAATDQSTPDANHSDDADDQNEANEQGEDVDDDATPDATHEAGDDANDDAADAADHNGHHGSEDPTPEPSSSHHGDD